MTRTVGAAVGAIIVILALATIGSRITTPAPAPQVPGSADAHP